MVIKLTSTIFIIHIQQIARITGAVKTTITVITDVLTSTVAISTFINICVDENDKYMYLTDKCHNCRIINNYITIGGGYRILRIGKILLKAKYYIHVLNYQG